MEFSAPSANKLPSEPTDLRPSEFRLAGLTFSKGELRYFKRRYFVGSLEVVHIGNEHDGDRHTAIFEKLDGFENDEVIHDFDMEALNSAVLYDGVFEDIPLRLCRDEAILKFAAAR